jgi:hypothetical protein
MASAIGIDVWDGLKHDKTIQNLLANLYLVLNGLRFVVGWDDYQGFHRAVSPMFVAVAGACIATWP